jgi:NAD(P)H-hydrate epimerase
MAESFNFDSLDIVLPKRQAQSHKGLYGRVAVIAGSKGMGGAGILASEASLFCGSGLVSLYTHSSNAQASLQRNPEIMTLGVDSHENISGDFDVILIGPGFSDNKWSKELSECISLDAPHGLILDAGALTYTKKIQSHNNKNLILTPHPGEAAALLGVSADEIQLNREDNAIDIAKKYNASAVVLKGHNTLVYIKSEDKTFICENGGPELATGGTGDILAGIISALLAQNISIKESCLLAVASHAKAGENFVEDVGEIGLNASLLIPMVRKILNK